MPDGDRYRAVPRRAGVFAAQHAFVVHGRLSWSAIFAMALVQKHPETREFRFVNQQCDARRATLRFERIGKHAEKGEYVVTIEEARAAGFLDGKHSEQWTKRAKVMLMAVAARECSRLLLGRCALGDARPRRRLYQGDD